MCELVLKLFLGLLDDLLFLLKLSELLDGVTHTMTHPNEVGDIASSQHLRLTESVALRLEQA